MKYLKKFETYEETQAYLNGGGVITPYAVYDVEEPKVYFAERKEPNYIKISSNGEITVFVYDNRYSVGGFEGLYFEYSYDKKNWNEWAPILVDRSWELEPKTITPDMPLYIRGMNTGNTYSDAVYPVYLSHIYNDVEPEVYISGRFSSLFNYEDKTQQTAGAFFPRFFGCDEGLNITDVSGLELDCVYPAYRSLLDDTNITSVTIPSYDGDYDLETYSDSMGFDYMLYNCSNLTDVYFTGEYHQNELFKGMFRSVRELGTLHCKPEMLSYFESQRDVMDLPSDWTIVADQ